MNNLAPHNPKIYHIVHVDRLTSVISEGCLWSDAAVHVKNIDGAMIGMSHIKQRRLSNQLQSHQELLTVGQCVPFYFCPRSVMLFIISRQSHQDVQYTGGQAPVIHLQADLHKTVQWANQNNRRWAFTDSNAGSFYFNDYANLSQLNQVDWGAVQATNWKKCREKKQAEFLLEEQFPWALVESIGVYSITQQQQVSQILQSSSYRPDVLVQPDWYY